MRPETTVVLFVSAVALTCAAPPKTPPPTVDQILKNLHAVTSRPTIPAPDLLGATKSAMQDLRRARKLEQKRADEVRQAVLKLNDYAKARFDRADITARLPTIIQRWEDRTKAAESDLRQARTALHDAYPGGKPRGDARHFNVLEARVRKATTNLENARKSKEREVAGLELRLKRLPPEIDQLKIDATRLLEPHLSAIGKVNLPGAADSWRLDDPADTIEAVDDDKRRDRIRH